MGRLANSVPKRGLALSTVERADKMMPDPVDHATGLEKYELLAKQAGNEDPFFLRAINRGKGTKDKPTIVNAMDNYRMLDAYVRKRTQLSSGLGYHREFLRDASVDTGWSSSPTLLQTSMRCPCKLGPYYDFVLVKTVLGNEFPILVLSP